MTESDIYAPWFVGRIEGAGQEIASVKSAVGRIPIRCHRDADYPPKGDYNATWEVYQRIALTMQQAPKMYDLLSDLLTRSAAGEAIQSDDPIWTSVDIALALTGRDRDSNNSPPKPLDS